MSDSYYLLHTYIEIATPLLRVQFISVFGCLDNHWIDSYKVFRICIKMIDNGLRPLAWFFNHKLKIDKTVIIS